MAVPGALHVMPCAGHCWWQAGMLMRTLAWPYLFFYLLLHLPSYEAGVTFFWLALKASLQACVSNSNSTGAPIFSKEPHHPHDQ
jgi:hypothetical protein